MKINEKQLKNIIRKAILKEESLNGKVNTYTFYNKLYQAAANGQDYVDNNRI